MDIKELFAKRVLEGERQAEVIQVKETTKKVESRDSLRETDVGITEFVSTLPGFRGIIKQRYSDFNVHEIDKAGNIACLNSYELPDESLSQESLQTNLLNEEILLKLQKMVEGDEETKVEINVTENTKEDRKEIHRFIKVKYGSAVMSNTVDIEDKKCIIVEKNEKGCKEKRREGHLPKFLHFIMSKSNTDNTTALSVLSSKLRIKINNLQIAGTKDKRANTSQWVSIKNAYASQLSKLTGLRNIFIGNYVYKDTSLALGDLSGNNFEIALRDIDATDEIVENSMTQLQERGFLNYYGMQRFGNNADTPTHEIGRLLLKGEFKLAVEAILRPRKGNEFPDMRAAREIYAKTHDAGRALGALKNKRNVEGQILTGLKKNGANAYVNALDGLPRNVQMLYLHAYQAYLWNKVLSRRIATHGLAVLPGDLIFKDAYQEPEIIAEDENEPQENVPEEKPCPVRHITAEEIENFTIYKIVLPFPGSASVYPKNEIADWFKEALATDGLTIDTLGGQIKKYSVSGGYRKILKKPNNLSWKIVNYDNPEEDLILSDVEIMSGKTIPERTGSRRALIIKFDLDPSVYATMALREILRNDTSFGSQSLLNGPSSKRLNDENDDNPAKKVKI